jgi:very-short-patch-repair endonuclease
MRVGVTLTTSLLSGLFGVGSDLIHETTAANIADVIDALLDQLPLESMKPDVDVGWKSQRVALQALLTEAHSGLQVRADGRGLDLVTSHGPRSIAKNLIFAANGPKPEFVVSDAISNDLEIVRNSEYCLMYDRPLSAAGVSWRDLTVWYGERPDMAGMGDQEVARQLYNRLFQSMAGNDAECFIFRQYCSRYRIRGSGIPALIPQVYVHLDPYTRQSGKASLVRQRMDFLLLFPGHRRIVVELDGRQHYADEDGRADVRLYAEMVAEDRKLRLLGYEVYRFGGYEINLHSESTRSKTTAMLGEFFDNL